MFFHSTHVGMFYSLAKFCEEITFDVLRAKNKQISTLKKVIFEAFRAVSFVSLLKVLRM